MFARRFHITLRDAEDQPERPAPKAWLDQFFMRNFTGQSAFDETLVAGDGTLEAGFGVSPEQVGAELEKWLRGRKMIGPRARLSVRAEDR